MYLYYYIDNCFCKSRSINNDLDKLITNYFHEFTDKDYNQIIGFIFLI